MNCSNDDYHIPEKRMNCGYIPNNVPVLHFFQERNLSNGGAGNPLILLLQANLLQCDGLVGDAVTSLVNDAVGSFTYLLNLLVLKKLHKLERKNQGYFCISKTN